MGEETIRVLFNKIDRIAEDVATIKAKLEEHSIRNLDHEMRLRTVETWKAGQEGIAGFLQRWGPVLLSAGIGIYVACITK